MTGYDHVIDLRRVGILNVNTKQRDRELVSYAKGGYVRFNQIREIRGWILRNEERIDRWNGEIYNRIYPDVEPVSTSREQSCVF